MHRVLVTGASGLLGTTLVPWLERRGHSVARHCLHSNADYHADLRDYRSTAAMLEQVQPNCIVNLAALTDVDVCERRPNEAYLLNVAGVEHICRWIRGNDTACHLIQVSTDQLYDGQGPHLEASVTILNTYALSKIAAELIVRTVPSTVLRTNFFGRSRSPRRSSFSDWIYNAISRNQTIAVFNDVYFSPLSMATLSDMIERVVQRKPCGVFNVGAAEGLSKAEFACTFAKVMGFSAGQLQQVSSSTVTNLTACRPKDMRMNSGLFEQTMRLRLPTVADEITSIRADYVESA